MPTTETIHQRFYRRHREAQQARSRAWKAANPEKVAAQERGRVRDHRLMNIRTRYGLTAEQYHALLGAQNGLCAACGMINDGFSLCVDHEHVEGFDKLQLDDKAKHVRALLCSACNIFIGNCADDPSIMRRKATALVALASYLEGAV